MVLLVIPAIGLLVPGIQLENFARFYKGVIYILILLWNRTNVFEDA